MLRVEKGTSQNSLMLSFRERPIVFSREFIQAFGIALALHLLALIIFHISPFKVRNPEVILPPSLVHIELPQSEGQVLTELQEFEPRLRMPSAPKWTVPGLPELPETSSFSENSLASMETILKKQFHEVPITLPEIIPSKTGQVQINISGPLSDCLVDTYVLAASEKMIPGRLCYAVKVETETGTVFWYEQLEGNRRPEIEQLLSALQFHPAKKGAVLSGEIEIVYD